MPDSVADGRLRDQEITGGADRALMAHHRAEDFELPKVYHNQIL
jgi:hypothetical protein